MRFPLSFYRARTGSHNFNGARIRSAPQEDGAKMGARTTLARKQQREAARQRSESPAPPRDCDTGVEFTSPDGLMSPAVHWLTATTHRSVHDVAGELKALLEVDDFEVAATGMWGYERQLIEPLSKIAVLWSEARPECCLRISGRGCELLGVEKIVELIKRLDLKATRVDLALDGVPFIPRDCDEAMTRDDIRTPSQRRTARFTKSYEEMDGGNTFTLGARSSKRYLRVYDLRETGTRIELELKEERAEEVAARIVQLDDFAVSLAELVVGYLRDFVDFVDRAGDKCVSRCALLPWWQAMVDGMDRIRVQLGTVRPSLERVKSWLQRQVACSLGVAQLVFGDGWVKALVEDGMQRHGDRHRLLLREAAATVAF